MSPEKARVFVANGSSWDLHNIENSLKEHGHQIVFKAQDLTQALALSQVAKKEHIDVAIIAADLATGVFTGRDGIQIADELKKIDPKISIIEYPAGVTCFGVKRTSKIETAIGRVNLGKEITKL